MGENPDCDPDATLLRRRPASCLLVSDHWDATRNWGEILTLKSGDEYAVHNCTVLVFIDGSGLPDQLFVGTRRFVPIPYVENVIKCVCRAGHDASAAATYALRLSWISPELSDT